MNAESTMPCPACGSEVSIDADCQFCNGTGVCPDDGTFVKPAPPGVQTCRVCGCWEYEPCFDVFAGDACFWIEEDLCSACQEKAEPITHEED